MNFWRVAYLLLGSGALAGVLSSPVWRWDGLVEVKGQELITSGEIVRALPPPGEPIFFVDPESTARRLEEIPAAREVQVRRFVFPARLEVILSERRAAALILGPKYHAAPIYLDTEGYTFNPRRKIPLPTLQVIHVLTTLTAAERRGFGEFVANWPAPQPAILDISNHRFWLLMVRSARVWLGPPEDLPKKIQYLKFVLPLAEGTRRTIEYLDVRIPDAPVFKTQDHVTESSASVANRGPVGGVWRQ